MKQPPSPAAPPPATKPNPIPPPRSRPRPSNCGTTTSTSKPGNAIRVVARQSAADIVLEILQAAELRHDLAPAILADTADDPANASNDDRAQVAKRLQQLAADAVKRAVQSAADAARTVLDAHQHIAHEAAVADAREDIADLLATAAMIGQTSSLPAETTRRWLDNLERLLPAAVAADRAAAAATARTAAADQRATARRRHPDIDDLIR